MRRVPLWLKVLAWLAFVGGFGAEGPQAGKEGKWLVPLGPSRNPDGPFATVRLPKNTFKGERPHGAALSLPTGKAVVFYLDGQLGGAKKTRVLLCDVIQGKSLIDGSMDGSFLPLDFDAEGTRVLCRHDNMGLGTKDTAEIWKFGEDGAPTVRRWVPYPNDSRKERDILWAAFVGTGRLATLSTGGQLIVWDVATLRRVSTIEASPAMPALSPNGDYLAFLRDDRVGLLDVASGKVGGFIPLGGTVEKAALAFRPDGLALLCAAKDKVLILDIASGRVQTSVIPGITGQGLQPVASVGWADGHLLFVNGYLVDPDVPVPIWLYQGSFWSRPEGRHVWHLASKGFQEVGLVPLRLPHAAALQRILDARADSGSFLLKPGDAVQVDIRKVPKEYQGDAQQALENLLRQTNYRPAATAALVLEVVPGRESFHERTYTVFSNSKEQRETHRFRSISAEVRLLKDGKEIWQKTFEVTPSPPIFISLKPGETAGEKLAFYSLPDYTRLQRLELPKFLQLQLGRGVTRMALGGSVVGPDGIEDVPTRRQSLELPKKPPVKPKR